MPDGGNFWTGISEGYFARRREHEAEAKQQEMDEKKQYFNLLANMVDKVEVESQPLLFKAMGDVLGAKGKSRSIWDFISGAAVAGNRQAAQKVYEDTVGRMLTPGQAQQLSQREAVGRMFSSEQAAGGDKTQMAKIAQQAQQQREGGIRLRDPRQEKMEEFDRQKQLLHLQKMAQLEAEQRAKTESIRLTGEENRKRDRAKLEMNATQGIRSLAATIANHEGYDTPTPEHLQEAASLLYTEYGLDLQETRAKIAAYGGDGGGYAYLNPRTGEVSLDKTPGFIQVKQSQAASIVAGKISQFRSQYQDDKQFALRLRQEVNDLRGEEAKSTAALETVLSKGAKAGLTIRNGVLSNSTGLPLSPGEAVKLGITREEQKTVKDEHAKLMGLQRQIQMYGDQLQKLPGGNAGVTAPAVPGATPTRPAKAAKPATQPAPKAGGRPIYAPITDKYKTKKVGETIDAYGRTLRIKRTFKQGSQDMFELEEQ